MTNLPNDRTTTWIVSMAFLLLMIHCIGCGVTQAPHAEATLRSSNQMKELILGIRNYHAVNNSQWPEQLSDVKQFTETDFDVLMSNPITDDIPDYEYVKPGDDANIATTVILYQLRGGQRATDLRVGYADGHVAELRSTAPPD